MTVTNGKYCVKYFLSQIKIISHKEKDDWQLIPKYKIGKKQKKRSIIRGVWIVLNRGKGKRCA